MVKNSLIKGHSKVFSVPVISLLCLFLAINLVSAILDTPTAIDVSREKPLIFDGKQVDYNPIWDKYKPQLNNMVMIQ